MLCTVAFCSGFLYGTYFPNLIVLIWGEEEVINLCLFAYYIAIDAEIDNYVVIGFLRVVSEVHIYCIASNKKFI